MGWRDSSALRTLATLAKDPCPIPKTHMAGHSYLQLPFQESWFPLLASAGSRTQVGHTHAGNTPTHKIKLVN